MIAVIAGATGLTGSKLLHMLLDDPACNGVIAITRSPLGTAHSKLSERVIPDFGNLLNTPDIPPGAVFFCAIGTTIKTAGSREAFRRVDHDAILQFGILAKNTQAPALIVVSAAGADPESRIFYNRVKGETETGLKGLMLPSLTILRPGLLIGDRAESRPAERLAIGLTRALSAIIPDAMLARFATDVDLLARVMLMRGKAPTPGVTVLEAPAIRR